MVFNYYKITNVVNDRFYIGITQFNTEKRIGEHYRALRAHKHPNRKLQTDWDRYGEESFKWETIESKDYANEEDAYDFEKELIQKSQAQKIGYNIANGGHLNPMYTESIKQKMIKTKQDQAENVYQLEEIDENVFEVVKIWPSQKNIQKETRWSQANIWHAIQSHRKSYNYYWILESQVEDFEHTWKPARTKITPTAQLDDEGNIVKVHHNMVTFCDEYGWHKDAIRGAIRRGGKAKGIKFIRISEEQYYSIKPITLINNL